MALVVSNIGTVDLPLNLIGASGQTDLRAVTCDITIQAADYSSGLALTTAAINSMGLTAVSFCAFSVRVAAGTLVNTINLFDVAGVKLMALTAVTPTHYTATNGDIFRCLVVGF